MAKKADFTGIGENLQANIMNATGKKPRQPQAPITPEELQQRRSEGRTQGRKGAKAIRFSVAFTPDNAEYIRRSAKAMGMTQAIFINTVLDRFKKEHPEIEESINNSILQLNGFMSSESEEPKENDEG